MDNGGYVMKDADPIAVAEAIPTNKARGDIGLMKQVMDVMQALQARVQERLPTAALIHRRRLRSPHWNQSCPKGTRKKVGHSDSFKKNPCG